MYKILVKSFIPEATEFPHSPLLREQFTPELELMPQFGSRSEVFNEEGNTTKLQQQSLQGSSSFPLAGTTMPPGLQLISHCIPRGDVGLEGTTPVPAISHCNGGFWVHTNHLRCPWKSLWILQALQTCLMSHVPKSSSPGGSFKPQVSPLDAMGSKDTWLTKGKSACAGTRKLHKAKEINRKTSIKMPS